MHFVDDEHLDARRERLEAGGLDDFPDVIDPGIGRRIHLHHVRMPVAKDGDAVIADAAGVGGGAAGAIRPGAVQGPGEDTGGGGFAGAAHAGEHEGMGDTLHGKGIAQGTHQPVLADQIIEPGGTVFAGQNAVGGSGRGGLRFIAEQRGAGERCGRFIFKQTSHAGQIHLRLRAALYVAH